MKIGGLFASFSQLKNTSWPIASTQGGYELLMTVVKSRKEEGGRGVLILLLQFIILEAS